MLRFCGQLWRAKNTDNNPLFGQECLKQDVVLSISLLTVSLGAHAGTQCSDYKVTQLSILTLFLENSQTKLTREKCAENLCRNILLDTLQEHLPVLPTIITSYRSCRQATERDSSCLKLHYNTPGRALLLAAHPPTVASLCSAFCMSNEV